MLKKKERESILYYNYKSPFMLKKKSLFAFEVSHTEDSFYKFRNRCHATIYIT